MQQDSRAHHGLLGDLHPSAEIVAYLPDRLYGVFEDETFSIVMLHEKSKSFYWRLLAIWVLMTAAFAICIVFVSAIAAGIGIGTGTLVCGAVCMQSLLSEYRVEYVFQLRTCQLDIRWIYRTCGPTWKSTIPIMRVQRARVAHAVRNFQGVWNILERESDAEKEYETRLVLETDTLAPENTDNYSLIQRLLFASKSNVSIVSLGEADRAKVGPAVADINAVLEDLQAILSQSGSRV